MGAAQAAIGLAVINHEWPVPSAAVYRSAATRPFAGRDARGRLVERAGAAPWLGAVAIASLTSSRPAMAEGSRTGPAANSPPPARRPPRRRCLAWSGPAERGMIIYIAPYR